MTRTLPASDIESRRVENETLHWNGIPVSITGEASTHPANWKLIGLPIPDRGMGTDAREIEQSRDGLPELPEPAYQARDAGVDGLESWPANPNYYTAEQMTAIYQQGVADGRRMGKGDE